MPKKDKLERLKILDQKLQERRGYNIDELKKKYDVDIDYTQKSLVW